ncbi:Valine--tRNA ligase [Neolecta irregularis DAH-3]|uniref:Valine--tRNA ligase, mitochondrial n=1 Tax=Neolecta irregularis (strain DAH-3) TaxID=1198029 RepID=A0A1U7LM59_NEOID|nr:Valine--tRNA ligase [Neolecta irregularis DAH-3]|eukprot:OLL23744.1 Valine--tRNA ligase [Neolecta irregularis DAH-3]
MVAEDPSPPNFPRATNILITEMTESTAPRVPSVPQGQPQVINARESQVQDCGKSVKELEKERKKAEKKIKFLAKHEAKEKINASKGDASNKKIKKSIMKEEQSEFIYQERTKPGDKKVLQDLENHAVRSYNPEVVESAWYDWWEKSGFFQPQFADNGEIRPEGSFVITAPPPNVTGALHMGHALTVAIQDSLIRWNRMLGKTVLYLPGFDHAGISTQSVVEKKIWYQDKKTRHDYGRGPFIDLVWKWKEEYHERITDQLKRLGGSFDWSREAFTMDENLSRAVVETFVVLHEEGIIYRANRLVNWCTHLNTTLSNLEVEQEEVTGQKLTQVPGYDGELVKVGVLTSFKYKLEDGGYIVVATTRPETMFGDTAIAVHSTDERYKHLIGKKALHPFVNRSIPIIADDIIVDKEFGSGAVKITPAHDPNDYEVGKRHNLEFINIMNDDGTLNKNAGEWAGVKRFHARRSVVEKLKELNLFVDQKDNPMKIPRCGKTNDIIEPIMKPQWWVDQKSMAKAALDAVSNGEIKIAPKVSERDFYRWLENIDDWCISRQLWWGHRAPVYFVNIEGEKNDRSDGKFWISGRTLEAAQKKAEAQFSGKKFTLEQDEDVLDTWFSSGLWPFSTLGWPKQTADFSKFYPTSMLETGWDILFFWVARMVMLGIKLTGKVPFNEVYCHSIIRDAQGRKMSKSLGNVIDPLDVSRGISLEELHKKLMGGNLDPRELEKAKKGQKLSYPNGIPRCGTDAMRFTLCAYSSGGWVFHIVIHSLITTGRDINLDILRVEGYRKFCNKIYNATKFALLKFEEGFVPRASGKRTGKESLSERWILHKLNKAADIVNKALEERNFRLATDAIYNYWLYELCDVYIENSKSLMNADNPEQTRSAQDTLYTALDGALKLIHPFMPYVTEELWQRLPRRPNDGIPTIMLSKYPIYEAGLEDASAEAGFDLVFSIVKASRSLMSEYNVLINAQVYVQTTEPKISSIIKQQCNTVMSLVKGCNDVSVIEYSTPPEGCAINTISGTCSVSLLVKGHADIPAEISKAKIKIAKLQSSHQQLKKVVETADYEKKVPADVRAGNEEKFQEFEKQIDSLNAVISSLEKMNL